MLAEPVQFWVDVGGTFTDCFLLRSDGSLSRHKLLSSGVTRSTIGSGSTAAILVDPARTKDPDNFWAGAICILLDEHGETERKRVQHFDARTGTLHLNIPFSSNIKPGQRYELQTGEEAPVLALRYLLGLPPFAALPKLSIRMGTTRGTNALLTRSGAPTALAVTRGFGDLLQIGEQNRPNLFELAIRKPEPMAAKVVEIDERLAADGNVLLPIDEAKARQALAACKASGIDSLAIALLHSYQNPQHEQQLARIAREVGFRYVSISSKVSPLRKLVPRAETTIVDAYLSPVLLYYVQSLQSAWDGCEIQLMTSAGGLVRGDRFFGKDSILSGPAGGVVGSSRVAQAAGFDRAIGFDMGGTSTDVSRFDGRYHLEFDTMKAGVRIVAPMMKIETVAAGGGSICWFDGVKLAVGPASAGAMPGPACYGRGGPLAVTDLNVFLGRIPPTRFPFPLDLAAVERRLGELADEVRKATCQQYTLAELAEGLLQIANANMAAAIRTISVAEGVDQRDYVLVSFGGAAPQHACAVADLLGMTKILNHPDAGMLSAYGIGLADITRHQTQAIYRDFEEMHANRTELESIFKRLEREAREELRREGLRDAEMEFLRSLDLRYIGVDAALTVTTPPEDDYRAAFCAQHKALFGYVHNERPLEVVAARVEGIGRCAITPARSTRIAQDQRSARATPFRLEMTNSYFGSQLIRTPLFDRATLQSGHVILGPAIIAEQLSTTVVEPGWQAEVLTGGELLLERTLQDMQFNDMCQALGTSRSTRLAAGKPADPVWLEIFNNQFAAIAAQMGVTLQNTASSVNVKQRLDFSCAIFTATGDLVVNAPHIPVHLGAMSESVRGILADNPNLEPGDVFVTNDPYRGGSHLPDVTVITPIHHPESDELLFFTASRAHHAEIGGIRPGSVPPDSTTLAEEGVLIQNFKLLARGQPRVDALRAHLLAGTHPTRNVADNLADIAAQVAANRQGERDLLALANHYGTDVVLEYMRHIQAAAAGKMRRALARLQSGRRTFVDYLDDGSPIAVAISIHGDRATIDFGGSGPVLANNLNANRAIVTAAVMYCLRLLIDEPIPLNAGVLEPVTLILPECLLNPPAGPTPEQTPAVVGGNTETSQRVVDVLLGALGLAAASQGTMNNLTFGDGTFGYYETICGGAGATASAAGSDAVHTHMTNTRLTDPEVVEANFPVRVREFSIRRGSGGRGEFRGGDGVVRRLEFLRPLEVCLLTSRRGPYPPYGLAGGAPGALGRNSLKHASGAEEILPGRTQFNVEPGDMLTIETPGGGGYGPA